MNTHPTEKTAQDMELLMEVDFKWLMAGQGQWVDPERLHHDPQYACGCLRAANNSRCEPLRSCAHYLQENLAPAH
jgi:hypothetical protein